MGLFPFFILGLIKCTLIGCATGVTARAMVPDEQAMRFRDTALLATLGSLAGTAVVTVIHAQSGYLFGGPSSLIFSVGGAVLALVLAAQARKRAQAHGQLTRS